MHFADLLLFLSDFLLLSLVSSFCILQLTTAFLECGTESLLKMLVAFLINLIKVDVYKLLQLRSVVEVERLAAKIVS